jgi:phage terminase large subunit
MMRCSHKQKQCLDLLKDNTYKKEILWGGAAGAGKSFLGCLWQIYRRTRYSGSHGIIIRQTRKDIYSTVLITFNKVALALGSGDQWSYTVNQQRDEIEFDNGSVIFLRDGAYKPSDPQYDRLKVEVMDAWIEEGTQVDERVYLAIRPRIREIHGGSASKLLITSNPGPGWVKRRFVKDDTGKPANLLDHQQYIQALVWDNLDKDFATNYAAALSELDPITKAMYLDGSWDVNINENPFFYGYNRAKHDSDSSPETTPQDLWLLSFDFNQDPCTLVVFVRPRPYGSIAIFDLITANQHTETGSTPLEAVCRIFTRKYITSGKCLPYFITVTGDASGRAGSADRLAKRDFYDTIARELKISKGQMKVPPANPPHTFSRELINHVLINLKDGLLFFTPECSKLCAEIQAAYPDGDGTLNKAKKEQGLHALDAWRYGMHYLFEFQRYKDNVIILNAKNNRT